MRKEISACTQIESYKIQRDLMDVIKAINQRMTVTLEPFSI